MSLGQSQASSTLALLLGPLEFCRGPGGYCRTGILPFDRRTRITRAQLCLYRRAVDGSC
jgi:hypothetical protein